jgi:hypothetical protein
MLDSRDRGSVERAHLQRGPSPVFPVTVIALSVMMQPAFLKNDRNAGSLVRAA